MVATAGAFPAVGFFAGGKTHGQEGAGRGCYHSQCLKVPYIKKSCVRQPRSATDRKWQGLRFVSGIAPLRRGPWTRTGKCLRYSGVRP